MRLQKVNFLPYNGRTGVESDIKRRGDFQVELQARVYPGPASSNVRLRELGLSAELLLEAIHAGFEHAGEFTSHDPPSAMGISVWRMVVRTLRDRLAPEGWLVENPHNYALTVHPSRKWALAVARGDGSTAQSDGHLMNKSPKGPMTRRVVEQNRQLSFRDSAPGVWDAYTPTGMRTWILLYYWGGERADEETELYCELSLPLRMDDYGHVVEWEYRIPISSIQGSDSDSEEYSRGEDDLEVLVKFRE